MSASISPTSSVWNTFHSLMYCVSWMHITLVICTETHLCLYIKFLSLLSNFNKNCNVLSNFCKIHTYQILCTYIQHISSFYRQKGRPIDMIILLCAFFKLLLRKAPTKRNVTHPSYVSIASRNNIYTRRSKLLPLPWIMWITYIRKEDTDTGKYGEVGKV